MQSVRWHCLLCVAALAVTFTASTSPALVVENMTGTTVAPADDPGWNYVSTVSQNFVYLGDGWALSAFHVGLPSTVSFNGQSFSMINDQEFTVANPSGFGTSLTDLRMIRINGDPGLASINIASTPINESGSNSFPPEQREVTVIGRGPARESTQSHWNVQSVSGGPDVWTETTGSGQFTGYKSKSSDQVKRWGKNLIADEDSLFGGKDDDLRGKLQLTLGVGQRDVQSMVTRFDQSGLANEAQAVSGDSGSSVFFKRNGVWELIGIVNAVLAPSGYDGQSTSIAPYGSYTTFADLSYYRPEILKIMNANPDYSVIGDIDLDGVVSGIVTPSGLATDDLGAFVSGWGYNNGTGVGTVTSWKNGDLNRDGKTDYSDFVMLRTALAAEGGGSLSFGALIGGTVVPEPASLITALLGLYFFAFSRSRRR
jgi:hypothetical protein